MTFYNSSNFVILYSSILMIEAAYPFEISVSIYDGCHNPEKHKVSIQLWGSLKVKTLHFQLLSLERTQILSFVLSTTSCGLFFIAVTRYRHGGLY
jgi:Trk-type K+ transport system membrane component